MQPAITTFTVYAPAVPSNIRSISVDGVLKGGTTENVLPKVKIVDNKGRELSNLSAYSNYYLGVKKSGNGSFTIAAPGLAVANNVTLVKLSELNSKSLRFTASSNAAVNGNESENFTFAIYKDATGNNPVAGSEINVKVTAADIKSLSSFSLSLPSAVYSADGNTGYDSVSAVVTGKTSDGTTVQIGDDNFELRDTKNLVAGDKVVPSRGKEEAKRGDFTDTVTAVVNDGKGSTASKDVVVSAKAPLVTKVEAATSELLAGNLTVNGIRDALVITDRYTAAENGVAASSALAKNTLQGIRLVSSASGKVTADWNNTTRVTFNGAAAGDMVTVQVTFAGGVNGTFSFKLK